MASPVKAGTGAAAGKAKTAAPAKGKQATPVNPNAGAASAVAAPPPAYAPPMPQQGGYAPVGQMPATGPVGYGAPVYGNAAPVPYSGLPVYGVVDTPQQAQPVVYTPTGYGGDVKY